MEEVEVFDIEFLHGCANPTIILIHQDVNGRHIKTHEISLKDKEFTKVNNLEEEEYKKLNGLELYLVYVWILESVETR